MFRSRLMIILLIMGLMIILYPVVSDFLNTFTQTRAISDYEKAVSGLNDDDFEKEFAKARNYNRKLMMLDDPLEDYPALGSVDNIFNIGNKGVIGYLTIKKIRLKLPIYYGTSDEVLNVAVGLMEGTSFPVGGKGTHAVLSGHRGLPSAELFSNVDQLRKGNRFSVTVLNRVFTYKVDQIKTVRPTQTDAISIREDKDYCSLITCTPYGVNTHRLIIRGTRVN